MTTALAAAVRLEKAASLDEALQQIASAGRALGGVLASSLSAMRIPGTALDPWAFMTVVGALYAQATGRQRRQMQDWTERQWVEPVNRAVEQWANTSERPAPSLTLAPLPSPGRPGPPAPAISGLPIPAPPPGMPERLREAWIQARTRGLEFARGLGNDVGAWTDRVRMEVWSGEEIATEADAEKRARALRIGRELTARAIDDGWTPGKLASRLRQHTGDLTRNWDRIARTELQAALNEGVAVESVRVDGPQALVRRVPESTACANCKRLFLNSDGKPRVFTVAELVTNGTNVGRKQAEWLPTLFPVHPHCMCGVERVDPEDV